MFDMIDCFFNPKSVAVIGASRNPKKFGNVILNNFLSGFTGKVFPVNPNADEINGHKCFHSVSEIKEPIDLAVISIPAPLVPAALKECSLHKVKSCIVITAGFGEVGNKNLDQELLSSIGKMRMIGPNVMGVFDSSTRVDTLFSPKHRQQRPDPGSIAFVSQSGAFGIALLDWCASEGIGISKFVSLGNKLDVNEIDMIDYLSSDNKTKSIALYIEGTSNGRKFYSSLKKAGKPIVVLKAGKTKEGERAVQSHTGSLAGESQVYSGAFRQAGVIEARTIEELFDFSKALSAPKMKGDHIQIITNGGGFGVVATDAIAEHGLKLGKMSDASIKRIHTVAPANATISNPLDLTGDASSLAYKESIVTAMADKHIDAVLVIVLFQIPALDNSIVDVFTVGKKPLFVCATGGEYTQVLKKMIEKNGIPVYPTPDRAVKSLKALHDYQ